MKTNEIVSKNRFGMFLIIFYITYYLLPFFSRLISSTISSYFVLLIVVITYVLFLYLKRGKYLVKMLPLIIIQLLGFLYAFLDSFDILNLSYSFLYGLMPVVVGFLIAASSSKKDNKIIFVFIIICFVTTLFTTLLFAGNDDVRYSASIKDSNDPYLISLDWKNIAGYTFVYSLVCIYPAIIGLLRHKKLIWKIATFAVLFIFFVKAEFTLALVVFLGLSCLWFLPTKMKLKYLFIFVILIILVFYFCRFFIADFIYGVIQKDTLPKTVNDRLLFIYTFIKKDSITEGAGTNRIYVYEKSIKAFLKHPILGCAIYGDETVGGHSYILDTMANYGVLGIFLLVCSYFCIYKNFYKKYKDCNLFSYGILCIFASMILSLINPGNHWFELCIIVPVFMNFLKNKEEAKQCT